ncbi:Branched-chain amino acid ABC transporter permease protein [Microbacterium oleivorans]|uniref:Branched-chain amino acid ABC transporter permease protein n=2 Tax=Microbacterium oleivorans TaxID=273677 RepID=A0A031FXU0_9MICO|nr:branched-chain amino acid ABC transporter permease [Microbacterium oleivorans]EZP29082.1 Branched-chain amino acid ABC transporter permease protein [Microbacterium oleivorans]
MTTTHSSRAHVRWKRAFMALLAALFSGAMLLGFANPASAQTDNPEDFPYAIQGNVRVSGEPVAGATVTVSGGGYTGEAKTTDRGSFRIPVPTQEETYTVELVKDSLPEGVNAPEGFQFSQEVKFGPTSTVTRNFTLAAAERTTSSFWDQFASRAVNGLNFGLMLALAAIGASLVFGTTGLSNFAHGEMVTFGALAALLFSVGLNVPIWVAIPLAVVVSGLFGYGMDAGLWRPLRRKGLGTVQLMIVSIGLSLALRYIFQMFIGGGTLNLPGGATQNIAGLGPITLSLTDVVSMGVSVVVIIAFAWWLMRTRIGRATRAVSDNPSLAAASGIDVDAVVRIVWIMAASLAGLSGVLWAYFRPGIKWDMGTGILLLIFAAITLGGLGTAFGALVGSIIVGLLVEVSTLWIPSDLKYVGALVVLIVILLFRPQGLLGRRERIG